MVEDSELSLSILMEVAACCISMLSSIHSPETFTSNSLFKTYIKNALVADWMPYFVITRLAIRNTDTTISVIQLFSSLQKSFNRLLWTITPTA